MADWSSGDLGETERRIFRWDRLKVLTESDLEDLHQFVAEYDRRGTELAEIRDQLAGALVLDATHEQVLEALRELEAENDELSVIRLQHERRGEVIAAVADAAEHVAPYPGEGLAERVAGLRRIEQAARALVRHWEDTMLRVRLLDALGLWGRSD